MTTSHVPEEIILSATAHAIPKPSHVDVPLPSSSTITNAPLFAEGTKPRDMCGTRLAVETLIDHLLSPKQACEQTTVLPIIRHTCLLFEGWLQSPTFPP